MTVRLETEQPLPSVAEADRARVPTRLRRILAVVELSKEGGIAGHGARDGLPQRALLGLKAGSLRGGSSLPLVGRLDGDVIARLLVGLERDFDDGSRDRLHAMIGGALEYRF